MMEGFIPTRQDDFLVIKDLRGMWLFIRRNIRLIGLIALIGVIFAAGLTFALPPRYAGETVVMLDPRKTHVSNLEAVVSSLPPDAAAIRSEIDIMQSRAVIDRIIAGLDLMHDADFKPKPSWLREWLPHKVTNDPAIQESSDRTAVAENLLKHLDVSSDGRSYSIAIRYRDRDPVRAANIANAVADQYLVDQLDVKYEATQRANNWLARRLDGLRAEVNSAEKAVEDYKIRNKLVGVGDETVTQQQLAAMNPQLLEARAERAQAEARLRGVRGLGGVRLETSPTVLGNLLIQQLKQQEAEVRRKEADLSTRYGDRHPMMINVRSELASIRAKIGEEIKKVIAGLQNDYDITVTKVKSMESELVKLENQTGAGNQATITLRQLEREASASRSLYEGFLSRSKQVAEQQDFQMADARIIARAEAPLKPYFPDPLIFVVLGLIFGASAGFIIAFLLEYLDRGFRALAVLEAHYQVAGLGTVPLADAPQRQLPTDYVLDKPFSAYAEAIRSVRAAVHFSNVDAPPKVVMVTSSLPNEGKTIFSASLARLLAKSGLRVLMIDTDMRRPHIHHLLTLDKDKPDLAMLLAGKAALEDVLQKDISGADIITSRSTAPNPQNLLGSQQMARLIATMREKYDMIILDTPPIMAVADAAIVARLADTTIYAVQWAATPREIVTEGLKRIRSYNIRLAGVILTQVNLREQKLYGYGDYGYYYGAYKNYYTN